MKDTRLAHLLKYFRLNTFVLMKNPFSRWARRRRMDVFVRIMGVRSGSRILDLGGHPEIWQFVTQPLHVTILNLPGGVERLEGTHHNFTYTEGDACRVEQFKDDEFDVVLSNSVIEHVGPRDRQREFASEVRRLGKAYWVQTPT